MHENRPKRLIVKGGELWVHLSEYESMWQLFIEEAAHAFEHTIEIEDLQARLDEAGVRIASLTDDLIQLQKQAKKRGAIRQRHRDTKLSR